MSDILDIVRPQPAARWVVFYSFADRPGGPIEGRYYDCHKIEHMREPTCLLAYEMNDERLNEFHGAPLRLQAGQVDCSDRIRGQLSHLGFGHGGYNEDHEFYGYRTPI
ncbi:molybdopterin-dependent oxidoreductase [Mycobacterium sherrisii]|uniref:Oxidoreductase molybdopterin-binding domain-containing protein n=1 Tax=Mycobacterium sherrisii TaxID=243061 RepID=A0A1E3SVU0_9MYCO|nr:molybdopterin-dependent oxidoreductase [Mycobacterium sherrisii]MEC4763067.1 molybdopterin-dependent oxidoreductase [Mycobacterium sherrisii]ODR06252.1 hypothetical protein BHQ21_12110 [Mycobacterium sherrisii]ORW86036.1 hypothetical protein AWC25_21125 [Mycobacterium sherrisii]